jgi:hypothetical protein
MKNAILSKAEAKAFLTRADLEKLEDEINNGALKATIVDEQTACIEVRGKIVRLFDVLELIGPL